MRTRMFSRLAGESGFTLIECLVAATVLVVGLLGSYAMLDGASGAQGASGTREGATNIAREFLETIRGDAYTAVNASELTNVLQAMPGYVTGSTPPVIRRRNINYTITATVCSVDDPKDQTATTTTAGGFCQAGTASATPDNQPDDLKQVRITAAWTGRRAGNVMQTAMLSSSGAVVGLPTQSLLMEGVATPAPTITTASTSCGPSIACFDATSTGATAIKFSVDGTDRSTPSSGVPMTATCTAPAPSPCAKFTWNYGSLSDGTYRIAARSVDANGVEGQPKYMIVKIAQNPTLQPVSGVRGGYNYLPPAPLNPPTPTAIFEIIWDAKPDRNVIGYTVMRSGQATPVCDLDAQGRLKPPASIPGLDAFSCIDMSPPAPSTTPATYTVTATYADLSTANGTRTTPAAPVSQAGQTAGTPTYTPASKTFGLDTVTTKPATCTDNLTDGFNGSTTTSTSTGTGSVGATYTFCTKALNTLTGLSGATLVILGDVVLDVAGAHTSATSGNYCTLSWNLTHNGTNVFSSSSLGTLSLVGAGATVQRFQDTDTLSSPVSVAGTETMTLSLSLGDPSTNCTRASVRYGATNTVPTVGGPGKITIPFQKVTTTPATNFARPTSPTPLSSSLVGADKIINWSGPAGASFYRIYRDTQLLKDRYDTCDVGDTGTGGCDKGSNNFTYTDAGAGGGHTYYVSTVNATMAESPQVQIP